MIRLALWALLWLAAVMISHHSAKAHEWYPWSCCSDEDCHAVTNGKEVERRADGWFVKATGETIPFFGDDRIKETPKEHGGMHLCISKDYGTGNKPRVLCLFVPEAGN